MLTFTVLLAGAIEILLPFVLAFIFIRKFKGRWLFFLLGFATFILSQLVHIPLLSLLGQGFKAAGIDLTAKPWGVLLNSVYLGMMAGLCEEFARYFGFKLLKDRGKPFKAGFITGIGHGGIESIMVGVSLLANYFLLKAVSQGGMQLPGLTPEIINSVINMPVYMPLVGAAERIFAIALHLTLSVLVWRAVLLQKKGWLWLAIGYHALVDAFAVAASQYGVNVFVIEGVLLILTVVNVILLINMHRRWGSEPEAGDPLNPEIKQNIRSAITGENTPPESLS